MIKELIVDMDNRFNEVFPLFNLFNKEFSPGSCLIDIFHSHFLFHCSNKQSNQDIKSHICLLDNIPIKSLSDPSYALVIFNTSIKNNIAISISHVLSSSQTVDLVPFYFIFHFYFHSVLLFYFLFLEQLGLGLIGHAVTPVTT